MITALSRCVLLVLAGEPVLDEEGFISHVEAGDTEAIEAARAAVVSEWGASDEVPPADPQEYQAWWQAELARVTAVEVSCVQVHCDQCRDELYVLGDGQTAGPGSHVPAGDEQVLTGAAVEAGWLIGCRTATVWCQDCLPTLRAGTVVHHRDGGLGRITDWADGDALVEWDPTAPVSAEDGIYTPDELAAVGRVCDSLLAGAR